MIREDVGYPSSMVDFLTEHCRLPRTSSLTCSLVKDLARRFIQYADTPLQARGSTCRVYVCSIASRSPPTPNAGFLGCIDVYNKVDAISLEQVDKLARQPNTVVISCEMDLKLVNAFYDGNLGH